MFFLSAAVFGAGLTLDCAADLDADLVPVTALAGDFGAAATGCAAAPDRNIASPSIGIVTIFFIMGQGNHGRAMLATTRHVSEAQAPRFRHRSVIKKSLN
jgi:hypothetical protein